jgi:hypothetical protein
VSQVTGPMQDALPCILRHGNAGAEALPFKLEAGESRVTEVDDEACCAQRTKKNLP